MSRKPKKQQSWIREGIEELGMEIGLELLIRGFWRSLKLLTKVLE